MMEQKPETPDRRQMSIEPPSTSMKVVFFLVGIVLPVLCLVLSIWGLPSAAYWGTGFRNECVLLLQSGIMAWTFFPFLLSAMVCLSISLRKPAEADRSFLIRFGVYSGVPLALQYCYILGIIELGIGDLRSLNKIITVAVGIPLIGIIAVGVPIIGWRFLRGMGRFFHKGPLYVGGVIYGMYCLIGVPVALLAALGSRPILLEDWFTWIVGIPLLFLIVVPLVSAPYWTFAVYAAQSLRIMRRRGRVVQFGLAQMLGVITWLAAYFAAWRLVITLVMGARA